MTKILAGDIGGTSARLGLFDHTPAGLVALETKTFASADFPGLAEVVRAFLPEGWRPATACFGVPCLLRGGRCTPPNLAWELDERAVARDLGVPRTALINDLEALGHGLALLGEDDIVDLQPAEADPRGVIALVGAGTGLGQGYMTWCGDEPVVQSSEGGHADFAPRTDIEARLLAHLAAGHGRVSSERVLSGPGLVAIYEFLRRTGDADEAEDVRRDLEAGDATRAIVRHGSRSGGEKGEPDRLSASALTLFSALYGAHCGNVALALQATGGVYLFGGLSMGMLDTLRDGPFLEGFRAKGRMADFMAGIPVRAIVNTEAALLGAATYAVEGSGQPPGADPSRSRQRSRRAGSGVRPSPPR